MMLVSTLTQGGTPPYVVALTMAGVYTVMVIGNYLVNGRKSKTA